MSAAPSTAAATCAVLLLAGAALTGISSLNVLSSGVARSRAPVATNVATFQPLVARRPPMSALAGSPITRNSQLQTYSSVAGIERVAPPEWKYSAVLPKVYVYDHCPFCIRVRMIYGLKNIRHDLIWLQNDDMSPASMHPQGKKVLPIVDNAGKIMIESLDIVKAVDNDNTYGKPILAPASGRKDIDEWVKSVKSVMGALCRPRYTLSYLPEFAFKSARDTFVLNHPIDKSKHKKGDPEIFKAYEEAYGQSPQLIDEMNRRLQEVEGMIAAPDSVSEGGLSYDDITFFARMRGLTLVKGVQFGPRLTTYMNTMAEKSQVPLYTRMAV
mmetsp:Transcript_3859/g.5494  ORF Transcript_3859/g.5494 Transcript_3859/m.5494 type:complete len:327 (-) Transcript_3859:291-1271(-)|eukprot:CAMPEP_0184478678 /NCGR_PEP_ID=MMETSP0113_2-20130426/644_1 /TAXON_ID=91329 /ORGANISM="Norrisiella sphaerica, Strain BC52" /LENGTH=326 /DNA_ID=CAMNT_0026856561 /DNA_START=23 /DNA_END=1003 /DNA_ORIENTATION=+